MAGGIGDRLPPERFNEDRTLPLTVIEMGLERGVSRQERDELRSTKCEDSDFEIVV